MICFYQFVQSNIKLQKSLNIYQNLIFQLMANIKNNTILFEEKSLRRSSLIKKKQHEEENLENFRMAYDHPALAQIINSKRTIKRDKPQSSNGKILPNIRYQLNLNNYAPDDIKQFSQTKPNQSFYSQEPLFENRSPALSTDRSDRRGRYFIFKSTDERIKKILQRQGWIENKSKNSNRFSLKWVDIEYHSDYVYLREDQYYNHIKNFPQIIRMDALVLKLKGCDFYPRIYDLPKQQRQFNKNFDQCALMILLKKHIEYFKIKAKHLVDHPVDANIVDILKFQKFTQMRNPHFLVNIPIVIQACIYYEQLLFEMGLIKSGEIEIKLDPKNIQLLVNYSKINPPYDEYQIFKQSYIEELGGSTRSSLDSKETISFSKDFQRYNGSKALDTPTDELISLLVKYSRIFHHTIPDYTGMGNCNNWILINKDSPEKPSQFKINSKNLSGINNLQNYYIRKIIEKPLNVQKIFQMKSLKVTTFVLIIIKQDCKIYFLNKHIARLQNKEEENEFTQNYDSQDNMPNSIGETQDFQLVLEKLNCKNYFKIFENRIKEIVLRTLSMKFLDQKRNNFEILKFNTIVDEDHKVWLENIKLTNQILKEYRDEDLSLSIGSQLLSIILDINYSRRTHYKYWTYISKKIPSKEEQIHKYGTLMKNNLLQNMRNKLSYYNTIRKMSYRYVQQVKKSLVSIFKQLAKKMEVQHVQKQLNICLASSILQRIFKKRIKPFFQHTEPLNEDSTTINLYKIRKLPTKPKKTLTLINQQ